MQTTINISSHSFQKLSAIQIQTNQDIDTIISQAISLYHQQIQPHCQVSLEVESEENLVGEEYQCNRGIELNWHHPSFFVVPS